MQAALMRLWFRLVLCALLMGVVLAVGAVENSAWGPTAAAAAESARPAPEKRWHLELTCEVTSPRDLRETLNDTPAPEIGGNSSQPWERIWEEQQARLSLSRDILDEERWDLTLGLHLGAAVGQFAASNQDLTFSEAWRTKPALLWGSSLAGELRRSQRAGPFLRIRCDYSRAKAPEDTETVTSTHDGTGVDYRDARFAWQRTDLSFSVGWRLGALVPLAGISYNYFVLEKRIHFHIPIPESPDSTLVVDDVPQRLNSRDSAFDYRNERLWNPHAGLEWRLSDIWLMAAHCTFSGFPAYSLTVRFSF